MNEELPTPAPSKSQLTHEAPSVPDVPLPELDLTGDAVGPPQSCQDSSSRSDEGDREIETADPNHASGGAGRTVPPSDVRFPVFESLPDSSQQRTLAVFGPYSDMEKMFPSGNSSVVARVVSTREELRVQLQDLKSRIKQPDPRELWLFHFFLTDSKGRPLLEGQPVSETELYSLLSGPEFAGVSVFQLAFGTTCGDKLGYGAPIRTGESLGPFCGPVDFYLFDKSAGKHDWAEAMKAVGQVVTRASTEVGLTGKQAAEELRDRYPELKFWQQSGVPSNVYALPESLPETTETPPQNQQVSLANKQPIQPDTEDQLQVHLSGSNDLHDPNVHPQIDDVWRGNSSYNSVRRNVEECERNAAVGITVQNYDRARAQRRWKLADRYGAEKDNMLIYDISKNFLCAEGDIHRYFTKDPMSWESIEQFIDEVAVSYSSEEQELKKLHNLYLFLSGHGCKEGIVTSFGETVKLEDLMKPLLRIRAQHLVVVYGPCRGDLEHPAADRTFLCGLSLPADETAGSCLPPSNLNCSAVFASMPGYVSYRDIDGGNFMLFGLHDVVHLPELAGKELDMKELAQYTQDSVIKRYPEFKNRARMQYTQRGDCRIRISGCNFQPRNEPRIPDVLQPFTLRL